MMDKKSFEVQNSFWRESDDVLVQTVYPLVREWEDDPEVTTRANYDDMWPWWRLVDRGH